jgi:lycopene cyclase domain-containing protein
MPKINQSKTIIWVALLLFGLPLCWVAWLLMSTEFNFDTEAAKSVNKIGLNLAFGETQWWYLMINLGSVFFPFVLSFDKKVHFYKKWKYLFPAITAVALFFVIWDIFFTQMGVWGFNDRYVNFMILGIPLGEWLFFITVPYACVFVHECLLCYFSHDPLKKYDKIISTSLIIVFLVIGLSNILKVYTAWTFLLSAGLLTFHQLYISNTYRTRFYIAYAICLIPFAFINGILTGAFNKEPVVLYNDTHNLSSALGGRFISIPYDDFGYGFLMILLTVTLYEAFRSRK